MNENENPTKVNNSTLLLPLLVSTFAVTSANSVSGLLLIEIGSSFGVSVGIAGQIRTLSYIMAIASALLLSALSIKYNHKSLLVIGLIASTISALGSGFSSNFTMMLLLYSINGIGVSMVLPMVYSLIAEYFSEEKRPNVIGLSIASQSSSYLIGTPIISYISGIRGWRMTFLGYIFPVALLSLILTTKFLPSTSGPRTKAISTSVYDGFSQVLSNRSALACLIGVMFSVSAFQAIVTYSVSFFRQKLQLSTGFATVYFAGASPFFILGSLLSGRLVKRVGRKTLTVVSAFLAGIFTMLFSNIPYIPVSMAFALASFVFNGMRNTAVNNLTQEQIPRLRGLMMSLYSAADNIGMAIGAGIGGYILLLYDYDILGLSLGLLGILSAIIFYFYTKDPTLPKVETPSKTL